MHLKIKNILTLEKEKTINLAKPVHYNFVNQCKYVSLAV